MNTYRKEEVDYTLYVCTDRKLISGTLEASVEAAILGGASVIQLREKDMSGRQLYETALRVKQITDRYRVPLIINDRVDIALAADASGVHLGQSDLPAAAVRRLLGKDKLIGVSAARPEEAVQAVLEGADYIGVGAVFPTKTKTNTRPVTMAQLAQICASVEVPIVVIGGINQENAAQFAGMGINGLAVISAVLAQKNITEAAAQIRRTFEGERGQ